MRSMIRGPKNPTLFSFKLSSCSLSVVVWYENEYYCCWPRLAWKLLECFSLSSSTFSTMPSLPVPTMSSGSVTYSHLTEAVISFIAFINHVPLSIYLLLILSCLQILHIYHQYIFSSLARPRVKSSALGWYRELWTPRLLERDRGSPMLVAYSLDQMTLTLNLLGG